MGLVDWDFLVMSWGALMNREKRQERLTDVVSLQDSRLWGRRFAFLHPGFLRPM